MSPSTEEHVAAYLSSLRALEPDPDDVAALQAARRPARRRRLRNGLALGLVLIAGSSTLATATGLVALPGANPDPIPPARVVEQPVPADVREALGVFQSPGLRGDAAASAQSAVTHARRAAFSVGSIRAVGETPLGEPAFVAYATPGGILVAVDGTGTEGPYPLQDVVRGTAWGVHEADRGVLLTAILPDGVARIRVTLEDGTRATATVRGNVAFAHLESAAGTSVDELRWIDEAGSTVKTLDL